MIPGEPYSDLVDAERNGWEPPYDACFEWAMRIMTALAVGLLIFAAAFEYAHAQLAGAVTATETTVSAPYHDGDGQSIRVWGITASRYLPTQSGPDDAR